MAQELKPIHISNDSEIGRILDEANGRPLRLEKNGIVYRVEREDSIWAEYDPEKVDRAVRAAAGTLTPEEGEALKAYIYRAREEGTRPNDRP